MTAKKMLSSIVCLRGERSGYKHLIQSVIVLQGKRISRRMRMEAVKADTEVIPHTYSMACFLKAQRGGLHTP